MSNFFGCYQNIFGQTAQLPRHRKIGPYAYVCVPAT